MLDNDRLCKKCGHTGPLGDFVTNKSCKYGRAHRCWRCHILLGKYGINRLEYDEMLLSQDGICLICGKSCPTYRSLSVDHDHETGRIRGLLCDLCNKGLGQFKDDPKLLIRAAQYLEGGV